MSRIYERLAALFDTAGLSTEQGSYAQAEISAYAAGAELLSQLFDSIARHAFFSLYEDGTCAFYSKTLGLDGAGETAVKNRYSHGYGSCAVSEALAAESAVLGNAQITAQDGVLTVSGLSPAALNAVGSFIAGVLPVGMTAELDGDGLTFLQWKALGKTFRQCDRLRLCFSCIDTLSTENFEQ